VREKDDRGKDCHFVRFGTQGGTEKNIKKKRGRKEGQEKNGGGEAGSPAKTKNGAFPVQHKKAA